MNPEGAAQSRQRDLGLSAQRRLHPNEHAFDVEKTRKSMHFSALQRRRLCTEEIEAALHERIRAERQIARPQLPMSRARARVFRGAKTAQRYRLRGKGNHSLCFFGHGFKTNLCERRIRFRFRVLVVRFSFKP